MYCIICYIHSYVGSGCFYDTRCVQQADHITDALVSLHWLRVPQRIEYKIAVLTYEVLHGSAPRYLGPLVPVADLPGRRALRCAGTSRLSVSDYPPSVVGPSRLSVHESGTLCHRRRRQPSRCLPSASEVAPLQAIVSRPRLLMLCTV